MGAAKKDCTKLENDICSILTEKRTLQSCLVNAKWKGRCHVIAFDKYRQKMCTFENGVQQFRRQDKVSREIEAMKDEIGKMKEDCKIYAFFYFKKWL